MDFEHYTEAPLRFAAELVNTSPPLEPEPDGLDSVEALRSFLLDVGFFDATDDPAALTFDDLAAFGRLRGQRAEVLSATDEAQAARGLNSILAECRSVPYVTNHDDSVLHLHFAPPKATPAQQAGASSAMGLALVLCEEGLKRFGTCADDNCVDVFVDNSKNTSRRFCSNKCSNRTAVAAHRARVRGKKQ
ncbi:MAG: CGNR zinc finger domain-containing protein [Actinomycetota bacterium]